VALDRKVIEDPGESAVTQLAERAVARDAGHEESELIRSAPVDREVIDLVAIDETDFRRSGRVNQRGSGFHVDDGLDVADVEHNTESRGAANGDRDALHLRGHKSGLAHANGVVPDRKDRDDELTRSAGRRPPHLTGAVARDNHGGVRY